MEILNNTENENAIVSDWNTYQEHIGGSNLFYTDIVVATVACFNNDVQQLAQDITNVSDTEIIAEKLKELVHQTASSLEGVMSYQNYYFVSNSVHPCNNISEIKENIDLTELAQFYVGIDDEDLRNEIQLPIDWNKVKNLNKLGSLTP